MYEHILSHVKREGKREACGVIIDNFKFIPCRNIHHDPCNFFDIHPDDLIAAEDCGDITAIVHSHPNGNEYLSCGDRIAQLQSGIEWWVVCDNSIYKYRPVPRLLGRKFEHGFLDCYSLFRDAYHLAGINLDDFERSDNWWNGSEELYLKNMEAQGFYQVDAALVGDVILMCLGSQRANHSAIYTGDQHILHHAPGRLSKRDVYGGFWVKHTHSIWRHNQWLNSAWVGICEDLEKTLN